MVSVLHLETKCASTAGLISSPGQLMTITNMMLLLECEMGLRDVHK